MGKWRTLQLQPLILHRREGLVAWRCDYDRVTGVFELRAAPIINDVIDLEQITLVVRATLDNAGFDTVARHADNLIAAHGTSTEARLSWPA